MFVCGLCCKKNNEVLIIMGLFNKKGQAALEFLTTYGWAFLIILVMIGGLSYFGVLDVSQFVPDSCKLGGSVECPSYALYEDQLNITIANNLPQTDITVEEIEIKEVEKESWCNMSGFSDKIDAGRDKDLGSTFTSSDCGMGNFTNDKKKFDLKLFYEKGGSDIEEMATGTMTTTVREAVN